MKKQWIFLFALALSLALSSCGSDPSAGSAVTDENAAYLGKYLCTGITMDELSMNPDGKWLELNDNGTVTIFLTEESDEAEWQLEGENFTMTIAGKTVGTGKLQGSKLILEMMGMEYDFVREGASAEQAGAENTGSAFATFTCYGNLYAVRYPTDLFHQDATGLSDLYSDDGGKGWITKLDTEERVSEWLTGFDEKATSEAVRDYISGDFTVSGYPARAIVYQDQDGWHSEVIVDFKKDAGNDTYPMRAAYIYFTGDTYGSVWNEKIHGIINSLSLGG